MAINVKSLIGGGVGIITSLTGMVISTSQLAEIVSIITSIGGFIIVLLTAIIIPIIRWWIKAKKDGKIDDEEIIELTDTIENGVDKVNSKNKGKEDK